ncbi:hypothetical protein [Thiopseudomonas alkaliphila]|uniref:hypothetical protein n=1 Tax=Thiopseudomonas alkaliphila TaxID=1697053 RepID=UPI00257494BA|nr:hypothetical protein [Thiopseudomonas alkaliphila]MDM1717430.1 hypothetical protein [Thiopseudomonas alkaliphila]
MSNYKSDLSAAQRGIIEHKLFELEADFYFSEEITLEDNRLNLLAFYCFAISLTMLCILIVLLYASNPFVF